MGQAIELYSPIYNQFRYIQMIIAQIDNINKLKSPSKEKDLSQPAQTSLLNLNTAFDPMSNEVVRPPPVTLYYNECFARIRATSSVSADLKAEFVNAKAPGYLPSPGRSPTFFMSSQTAKYLVKELKPSEVPLFLGFVQDYATYLETHPDSLLIRYLLFFKIDQTSFIIMPNAFAPPAVGLSAIPPAQLHPRLKYDLKGSTVHRTSKGDAILKDNNCNRLFVFDQKTRATVVNNLKLDSLFLKQHGFLDYSLLVGVTSSLKRYGRFEQEHKLTSKSLNAIMVNSLVEQDLQLIQKEVTEQKIHAFLTTNSELCYLQIIDFFTVYTPKKQMEKFFKSFAHPADQLSVQTPDFYCERFQRFISEIIISDFGM
ncbi:Phosphatidylinositol-4-phosphate_5-kinase [Hexamita inflata]|uniref:Putative n=1 Tax=Hexamita inflata TaxID=28002 RepID=A0AA86NZ53_9EUKA|nr:Phosphatidylinositol-4-phosphate 5-kinase [Hexamita inflata]